MLKSHGNVKRRRLFFLALFLRIVLVVFGFFTDSPTLSFPEPPSKRLLYLHPRTRRTEPNYLRYVNSKILSHFVAELYMNGSMGG